METKLKKVITDAAESNSLPTIDWENLPLPQEMIQSERNRRPKTSTTSPWIGQGHALAIATSRVDHPKEVHSKKRKSSGLDDAR
jgi:hypothetical protein